MKVYIETYGCALNKSDEALMINTLLSRGHTITGSIEEADVLVINTCTVRLDTEYRMVKRIKELHDLSLSKGKKLIVAGCMAKAQPYKVSSIAPTASLVSPQASHRIHEAVESSSRVVLLQDLRERGLIGVWLNGRMAPIPAQEGCLGNCSFCIVKHARRILVSHPIERIKEAVREAVVKGAVEIELTGMDLGTYGIDLYKKRMLPELVLSIAELEGSFMVRIGMMNPEHLRFILDGLVEALKHPKVFKFLHIPLQSGSNRILKLMKRGYTVEEYVYAVEEIRSKIPDVSIATDIIVGFPTETEEDFQATLDVIKRLGFERVHLAAYSIRPHTLAASMPQVPTQVKKDRVLRALKLIEEVGLSSKKSYVNTTQECFVTEKGKTWVCRLRNYIPVAISSSTSLDSKVDFGKWVNTRIVDATFYDLRGIVD
ncbi:tRNA (N(6)-L-threonylcarbamoyladenosine(37)-C(2))-methylthiotransferase [Thermogladius sp. 4427co]|uniref:tRNA (N(6)-L-threonylcarbamoyladenosine(37)-C(2))- methylthiotransferase n=1 Tax=Thermogladius sp. 4427co TaxID=3450718 RepID=UPI003F79426B